MSHIITSEQIEKQAERGGARAFGGLVDDPVSILCPDCAHGIDPHGSDPGGPCGVGDDDGRPCPCLMQPSGIAHLLIGEAK